MVDYKVTSTEQTVESQVAAARAERDRVALWSRVLPIGLGAAGLVSLVGGALLGLFSTRVEGALPRRTRTTSTSGCSASDETGPMPAAQAPTEKIPTRRATALHREPRPIPVIPVRPAAARWAVPGYALALTFAVAAPPADPRLSADPRCGLHSAVLPVRCGPGHRGAGAAGGSPGLRGGRAVGGGRRRRGGQGRGVRGAVLRRAGRRPARGAGAARVRHPGQLVAVTVAV